jgi:hypothetical protein
MNRLEKRALRRPNTRVKAKDLQFCQQPPPVRGASVILEFPYL